MSEYKKNLLYDEAATLYGDKGVKRANYQIVTAVMEFLLAGILTALVFTAFKDFEKYRVVNILFLVAAGLFFAGAVYMTVLGIVRFRHPKAMILEKDRLILRDGMGYRYFNIDGIKSVEADTLGGKFSFKSNGVVDMVIKNGSLSFSEGKRTRHIYSESVNKFAYVLYNRLLNSDTCVDWETAYDSCKVRDGDLFNVKRLYVKP